MDSKLHDESVDSDIYIASNMWTRPDGQEPTPYEAAKFVPGDLMVELVGTRDKRVLATALTRKQDEEYRIYRFFLHHGQSGLAFDSR